MPREVIYKDDEGAVYLCWIWRDRQRMMLAKHTANAFLIIESVKRCDLEMAASSLAERTKKYIGGSVEIAHMNFDNRELIL